MLPLAIALVILVPSILVAFDITPIPLSVLDSTLYICSACFLASHFCYFL
jgi:hypothetical protein